MAGPEAFRFVQAAPELPTRDLGATKAWYERHLGFRALGPWQEWKFLVLERDGVLLHFFLSAPEAAGPPADAAAASIEPATLYLRLAGDIDALAARLKALGADLHGDPEDRPWGLREFSVHDADGRHVRIGKPLGGA